MNSLGTPDSVTYTEHAKRSVPSFSKTGTVTALDVVYALKCLDRVLVPKLPVSH